MRSVTSVAFSVEPSTHPERMLGAVDVDTQGHHAAVAGEVHAVDH